MAITLYPEIPSSRALYSLEKGDSYHERQINQTTMASQCQGDGVGAGYCIRSVALIYWCISSASTLCANSRRNYCLLNIQHSRYSALYREC